MVRHFMLSINEHERDEYRCIEVFNNRSKRHVQIEGQVATDNWTVIFTRRDGSFEHSVGYLTQEVAMAKALAFVYKAD